MEEWYENPFALLIMKLIYAREGETSRQLEELEKELRTANRYFPKNKIIEKIDNLINAPHKKISENTIIYRGRKIDKYKEKELFADFFENINYKIKEKIPDFNINGGEFELIKLKNYQKKHNLDNFFTDSEMEKFLSKYRVKSWWGYNEKESDAPPPGTASVGRINPNGISYLYASNKERTALLEIRPILSQYVSIAEIEIVKEIKLFDFTSNYDYVDAEKHFNQSIDLTILSTYFSQPNYSGDSAYLATQYISEYIKNLKDEKGNTIFDGLCFGSSLDKEGLNYVLFDVSDSKKYKVKCSSIFQVLDLQGNMQRQLPIDDTIFTTNE